jgi:hypothetical protein
METGLWKRLDSVSNSLTPSNFLIVVCRQSNESQEDVDRKIARWRAGEDVLDITAKPYDGNEDLVIELQRFGLAPVAP